MEKIINKINILPTNSLVRILSLIFNILRERQVIRSKNITGDLGEHLVELHYCESPELPNMKLVACGTKHIDALMEDENKNLVKRVSIKSITGFMTSEIYGLEPKDSIIKDDKKFDIIIINKMDNNYESELMIELTWVQFLKLRKWHTHHEAWVIRLNNDVKSEGKIVLDNR